MQRSQKARFTKMKYRLKTFSTSREFDDAGWLLDDEQCVTPSLIRALYRERQIRFGNKTEGIFRFEDWLPTHRRLSGSCAPVTYKSEGLARHLGLENLYITLSGYYPQRGVTMSSATFKETEAYTVCARMDRHERRTLVVASAGNTARAFARVCSENNIPLLLCVPLDYIDSLWSEKTLNDCVKMVCVESGADYFDAIHLSNVVVKSEKFFAEGGAKNVARRDGMATTMLSATEFIGRIPDYYFQAVGSGTGAIAAWEANLRLIEDGRFGDHKARLVLSQNVPFTPMCDAWNSGQRALADYPEDEARRDAGEIIAKVLSNRRPPYSIAGGLFDALTDTAGVFTKHTNEEVETAMALFERLEGVDIFPAAGTAVASLLSYFGENRGALEKGDVMLNITGGGYERLKQERELIPMKPCHIFKITDSQQEILDIVENL